MLKKSTDWKGLAVHARDGDLGTVNDFYFDDETWAIRYIVLETGSWLFDKPVLISPISVIRTDWQAQRLDVSLTKDQVAKSPDINTREPVSRQHEAAFLDYYGYPYYWAGPYLWGPGYFPAALSVPTNVSQDGLSGRVHDESMDSHLRSAGSVTGYRIESSDGEIGHVDGFIVDEEAWAIRYVEVATRNWWPGKKVLIPPAWIQQVSWEDSQVTVGLSRESIKAGPEYDESVPITRDYESLLHSHFGQPRYWMRESEAAAASVGSR